MNRSSKDLKNQSVNLTFELAICGLSIFDVISNIFQIIDNMMRSLRKKRDDNGLYITQGGRGYIMIVTLVWSESVISFELVWAD